jgi:Winged helix-turn-helix DNA-binding
MMFTADSWPGIADGSITVTFRDWTRAQAKPGGRYRIGGMLLEATAVGQVDAASITEADARQAGEPTVAALQKRLKRSDGLVWRVDFHYLGDDDRIARRTDTALTDEDVAKLQTRLDRLDATPPPWTRKTLELISTNPGMVSTVLAELVGIARPEFKMRVRKLKEMGLTESLEVGYRISPRGQELMRRLNP